MQAVLVVVLLAEVASARLAAQEHLRQGNAAFLAGHVPEAIAEYETAERLFPSPQIFYNLGQAYEAIDRKSDALEAYEKFIAGLSADPNASDSGAASSERRRRVENARARADTLRRELVTDHANALTAVSPVVSASVPKVLVPVPIGPPAREILVKTPSDDQPPPARSRARTIWLVGIGLAALAGAVSTIILIQRSRDSGCTGMHDLGCIPF